MANKTYIYNPQNGAPIKNWYDGSNFWKLDIDECKAFPEAVGRRLKRTYEFLQEISGAEFEAQLGRLASEQVDPVRIGPRGEFIKKSEEELKLEENKLENKKEDAKKKVRKAKEAKDAEPYKPNYYEMNRGALINEIKARKLDMNSLNVKGVYVNKEQLIQFLQNDDSQK